MSQSGWAALMGAAAAGCLLAGCGGSTQSGLVNAPGPNRTWTSDDLDHDAISNGQESCAKSGKPEDDPLKNRVPPCPEARDPDPAHKGPIAKPVAAKPAH